MNREVKDNIVHLGGSYWSKGKMERVYITCDILNKLLQERGGLGVCNYGASNNKIFYDIKTNKVMRQYKRKQITVEIDYEL